MDAKIDLFGAASFGCKIIKHKPKPPAPKPPAPKPPAPPKPKPPVGDCCCRIVCCPPGGTVRRC